MRNLIRTLAASAFILATAPSFAHDPAPGHAHGVGHIEITNPWTRATPPAARVGGGYLVVTNNGASGDRLVSGSSPIAGRVEIHTMEMDGDVMKMRPLTEGLEIPAGETVELAPGGYHLMLMELTQPIAEGDAVAVTLRFENAGPVDIELVAGSMRAASGGHGAAETSGCAHEGHD